MPLLTSPIQSAGLPTTVISNLVGGKPASLPAPINPDEIAQLQPLSLGNGSSTPIYFPGLVFGETQSHSLAVHRYPNLDAARVENMGREPARFQVKAILTNNIYTGTGEQWTPGKLFPYAFNQLYAVLSDNTDKTFEHPIYGKVNVQVVSWTYTLDGGGIRDGAIMEFVLVESINDSTPLTETITAPQSQKLYQAAAALDANFPTSDPPGVLLSGVFSSVASSIVGAIANPLAFVSPISLPIIAIPHSGFNTSPQSFSSSVYGAVNNTNTLIHNIYKPVPINSILAATNSTQDPSLSIAIRSLLSINQNGSQGAFLFIDKVMRATIDLTTYYVRQNSSTYTPVITNLQAFLAQCQNAQSALSQNTPSTYAQVATYVTPSPISWLELSQYLHNDIDDLLALNNATSTFVLGNTVINYRQS